MTDEPALDTLVWLRDTNETIASHDTDIRGRKVIDVTGTELGHVSALLIDQTAQKVRFFEIAFGGFLGLGRSKALIPIDAIASVDHDTVRVDQTKDHVAGSPGYDPELADSQVPLGATYGYYGLLPYWGAGYIEPQYSDTDNPARNATEKP